jgi:hypothetical protein
MNEAALEMCRENYKLNGIHLENSDKIKVRKLQWGSKKDMCAIQQEVLGKFDAIVGADIVYPATCGVALHDLFATVSALLAPQDGTFYLSFATRDHHRTPQKLLQAASAAGFKVTCAPPLDCRIQHKLPPFLDAKILILQQCNDAQEHNDKLGGEECLVFPGLKAAIVRAEEASSDEEWEAPFCGSDCD